MYTQDTRVAVFPFTRQAEGGEIVIGRVDTGTFLSLPPEALEILDSLASGVTVGRAQEIHHARYGETPEMEDFLSYLQSKGFVWPGRVPNAAPSVALQPGGNSGGGVPQQRHFHFANISQPLAQALFGPTAFIVFVALVALAATAVLRAPAIFPGRSALFFHHDKTLMLLCLVLMGYTTVFFHEMGHLVAARSRGVSSRLGIGRRMWMLVAETDMTGLWSVPREQRYLPILGGPLVDVTSGAVMLLVVFASYRGWITLVTPVVELLRAMIFVYLMRLIWQCFFFVRTDFYYLIANFFGCKSLMQDTQIYIQNQFRRLISSRKPRFDQSHLPVSELRVIRAYSWVWILGRSVALISLFFITLPVMFRYLKSSGQVIFGGLAGGKYAWVDALFVFTFNLLPLVLGLGWWLSSMVKRWRMDDEKRAFAT